MKTLHNAPENREEWPEFWNEDWLRSALDSLDTRTMSPEELLLYHTTLAREAHTTNVARKLREEAIQQGIEQGIEQGIRKQQQEMVDKMLATKTLSEAQIADFAGVTVEFVQQARTNRAI